MNLETAETAPPKLDGANPGLPESCQDSYGGCPWTHGSLEMRLLEHENHSFPASHKIYVSAAGTEPANMLNMFLVVAGEYEYEHLSESIINKGLEDG